jgi:deoxyribonuclease-4
MGLLGAHISISGGLEKSISRGHDLGCEAIQIFSKNQRQWKSPGLSDDAAERFRQAREESSIKNVAIHDSYLINLAHSDPEQLKKSRDAFFDEMERAEKLDVEFLIFHPGSYLNTSEESGIRRIADSLNHVISRFPESRVQLLLETTSGSGHHLGYRFEQLAAILSRVHKKDHIGVCFDTAHVFAAGYDMREESAYEDTMAQFQRTIGLDRLMAFHLNDSKSDLGSRIDRHENIGMGVLGESPFRCLVNDSRFRSVPMILETPEGEKYYRKNLALLKSFID